MIQDLRKRYNHMKDRCYNPKDKRYNRYGGRGIKICQEWLDDYNSFERWALNHGYQKNLQIDRIDNDCDYTPNNCRFVTCKCNNNNRSTCRYFTYNGKTQNLMQWCEEYSIKYSTALRRAHLGWDIEQILFSPKRERDKKYLIGSRFGRLIVISYVTENHLTKDRDSRWLCKCDCGNTVVVRGSKLKSGHTQSCGCLQKDIATKTILENRKKIPVKNNNG